MEYNTNDQTNSGKIGFIRDHSRKIMQEINDLQYSIDVVENDMECGHRPGNVIKAAV
ncbi:MAG: hypothetical protein HQL74_08325 [Magnetococcales bacterium]|nr:hypothetical protein [Magnetococcales bacterium]